MRIASWILTVLFGVVLAQTLFLLGQWLTTVAAAGDWSIFAGSGQGFGDVFARVALTLMLWSFARSARETARARHHHQEGHPAH